MIAPDNTPTQHEHMPFNPWWRRHQWTVLCVLILALAALVRVWFLVRANWMLDGDEATMALVGRHIQQHHERPIYFPGQAYMGAWQAYVAALLFELFGMSRPVAKLGPLLTSVAFVGTIMLLARRIYDRNVALLAGLFSAIPSVYVISVTVRISYPLIDIMTIGNVILLISIDTAYREKAPRWFIWRCLVLGVLSGFAFWMHSAVAMYVIPAALLLFLRYPCRALWPGFPVALSGFIVGALPVFNHALQYDYTLFDYLLGSGSDVARHDYPAIVQNLLQHLLPRYLGVQVPWQSSLPGLNVLVGAPSIAALMVLTWRSRRALWQWVRITPHPTVPRRWIQTCPQDSHPEVVLLLFTAVILGTYVVSRFSVYASLLPQMDATGRYIAPLATVIPLVLAGAAAHAVRWGRVSTVVAALSVVAVLSGTVISYTRTEPKQVFQSPYFRQLPPSNAELIAALDDMGVTAVWIDHWAGKPLMFDTDERIAATDYVDLVVWDGIDRLPADSHRVFGSTNTAYVFVTTAQSEPHVPLEATLRARGIPFDARYLDGYTVVHPLTLVDPATVVDDLIAEP